MGMLFLLEFRHLCCNFEQQFLLLIVIYHTKSRQWSIGTNIGNESLITLKI